MTVDDDTHPPAGIKATRMGASLPAMPRDYLLQILEDDGYRAPQETGPQRGARNLEEIIAKLDAEGVGLDVSERLGREELYGRRVSL